MRAEARDDGKDFAQVAARALGRVGQIEIKETAGFLGPEVGQHTAEQAFEYGRHVGDHGPVDQGDQVGAVDEIEEGAFAHRVDDAGQGDVIQPGHGTEHDLTVFKLNGMGDTRSGDADRVGPFCEFLKHFVHWLAEGAHIPHLETAGDKGVSHDRAIAAELLVIFKQLDIGGSAGCVENALAEGFDRRNGIEVAALSIPVADGLDDLVDKAVQADDGLLA